MMRQVAVGVIGHVDHGKTSLVHSLTGTETDRLKEEKTRGMSIVLGFAHLTFVEGVVDLIDVPGHEHFVRAMVAGATGITAAMLVVDLNEGAKPQTTEHLAITGLLGIQRGVVVLTKSDLASDAQRIAALASMRSLLRGTYLELAPIIFASVLTGEGIAEVAAELRNLLTMPSPHNSIKSQFYLPVDRVFILRGRGSVMTGTLRLGTIKVGDEVEIMPSGRSATVRQLQLHNQDVDHAFAGQRVGVNLRQVRAGEIVHGDILASPGLLVIGDLLDVSLCLLASVDPPFIDGQVVRLLFGTSDVSARVRLLCSATIEPGTRTFAQLRTAQPVACAAGEPFIIRRESPPMTIGGGRVIVPAATRHRRCDVAVLARLEMLAHGDADATKMEQIKAAGYAGLPLSGLVEQEGGALSALLTQACVVINDQVVLYRPLVGSLGDMVNSCVHKFHQQSPAKRGLPLATCRASLPRTVADGTFKFVLHFLSAARRIVMNDGLVYAYGYDPLKMLSAADHTLANVIEEQFQRGGVTPPDIAHIVQSDSGKESQRREKLIYLLSDVGHLLLLEGQLPGQRIVFHKDAVAQALETLSKSYTPSACFTIAEVRVLLGTTRKFIVPLMEHFDAVGYTRRRGDQRVLVHPAHGGE